MKNRSDSIYDTIKQHLANKNKEITSLYCVGKKNRDMAIEQGITRYDDPNLDINVLGLIKSKCSDNIEQILKINNSKSTGSIIVPKLSNENNWKSDGLKCYVDIETINNVVYNLKHDKPNFIFMIGVGFSYKGSWTFKVFTAVDLCSNEEERIIEQFNDYMAEINEYYNNKRSSSSPKTETIPIFHWSSFEQTNLEPFIEISDNYKFVDMCKWFINSNIAIKGALDYKLKSVTKAMYDQNLIDIEWPEDISNGLNAMNVAYNYYANNIEQKLLIENVEKYNEVDCRSMFEIHNYLRSTKK